MPTSSIVCFVLGGFAFFTVFLGTAEGGRFDQLIGPIIFGIVFTGIGLAINFAKKQKMASLEAEARKEFEIVPRPADAPPPTPDESKHALNHLRVSNAFYDDAFNKSKNGDEQIRLLTRATRELLLARKLDPRVTLTTNDENGRPFAETQDDLAAKYLYYESRINYINGEGAQERADKWYEDPGAKAGEISRKQLQKRADERKLEALGPAEKAVNYAPNNLFFLQHLVRVYDSIGNTVMAKQTLDRASKLDPDNIETLKLQSGRR